MSFHALARRGNLEPYKRISNSCSTSSRKIRHVQQVCYAPWLATQSCRHVKAFLRNRGCDKSRPEMYFGKVRLCKRTLQNVCNRFQHFRSTCWWAVASLLSLCPSFITFVQNCFGTDVLRKLSKVHVLVQGCGRCSGDFFQKVGEIRPTSLKSRLLICCSLLGFDRDKVSSEAIIETMRNAALQPS